jgi:hypothetical protein
VVIGHLDIGHSIVNNQIVNELLVIKINTQKQLFLAINA